MAVSDNERSVRPPWPSSSAGAGSSGRAKCWRSGFRWPQHSLNTCRIVVRSVLVTTAARCSEDRCMNAQTPGPARDLPERSISALRRTFATWPRRIGAIVGSALLAWAVAQFAPALWEEASERTGLAPASLQVEVVMDPDLIETAGDLYNPSSLFSSRSPRSGRRRTAMTSRVVTAGPKRWERLMPSPPS